MMAKTQPDTGHDRVQHSLLSGPERRFTRWFCARAPARVTPDVLTAIGVAGSLFVFAGYALSRLSPAFLWLASFGLLVNWFGDSTDGNLARHRRIERPRYGFFIDHSVDSLSMLLVFAGLGVSPYLRMDVALFGLVAYLLMSIFVYLDTLVNRTFQISFGYVGPTEARLGLILANTAMWAIGRPRWTAPWGEVYVYDGLVTVAASLLVAGYVGMTSQRLRRLAKLDPPGGQGPT